MKIRAQNPWTKSDRTCLRHMAATESTIAIRRPEVCVSGALPAAAFLGFGVLSSALAEPTGGVVVQGQGAISAPAPGATVIDQASQHLQVNWSTFNVAASESVQFNQPSASAVALNRILDQNPSQIFGSLRANGQVILVNPNGMLFGPSAQLNVGALVASSLEVIGFDAATGRYAFGTSRANPGAILNEGLISAAPGGSVTLLGGRVSNTGSIIADFGTVNLAAGRSATLDLAGDGLLRLEVDADLIANESGAASAVENGGSIQASGGRVLLSAQAMDGVFANLVNNTGVVRANRIDNSGGVIRLLGADGTVRSSGVLDASAGDAVSTGGRVEVLGEYVGLFDNARVEVSGATGGGTALIGGDYQGKNPTVLNARRTYVGADAVIDADAGTRGDGGRVIVWADEITRFGGHVSARGGVFGGNGGFAEVSGKQSLVFAGTADLGASNGFGGTLLLDPDSITITDSADTDTDIDDGTYAFAEDAGTSPTIGNQRLEELLGSFSVVLEATIGIEQRADADIDVSGDAGASGHSLTLRTQTGDIVLNGDIALNAGALTLEAGAGATLGGSITTGGGAVSVTAGTGGISMQSGSSIDAGIGGVTFEANQNVLLTQISTTGTAQITSLVGAIEDDGDGTTVIAADTLTLNANSAIGATGGGQIDTDVDTLEAEATNGSVYIGDAGSVTISSLVADGGGSATVTAGGSITATDVSADGTLSLTAGTDITVGALAGGAVTLIATAGSILDDGANGTRVIADDLSLEAGAGIGAATGDGEIDTEVVSLTAEAGSGSVYIGELNAITLDAVSADNGAVSVTAGSAIIATDVSAGDTVSLVASSGDITLGSVSAGNDASVQTLAGAIVDDGDDGTRIAADALTLAAGGAIGGQGAIDTDVTSLTASTSGGGIFISELHYIELISVAAVGAGSDVSVTSASGDIVVAEVSAPDAVTLTATAGSILDDAGNNDPTLIQGGSVTLSAANGIGTVADFGAATDGAVGSSIDVQTSGLLDATVTSNTGQINLNVSGAPIFVAGAITLGSGTGRGGAVVLQSASSLNLATLPPGIINIGSDNVTSVGLRSGGVLTLPSSGGLTDQTPRNLLVKGTVDVVDSGDATPRELSFTANALDFRSGATVGSTTLNTQVVRLDATVGAGHDLTINEADAVTLGTISAAGGDITLTALGAVTDDGDDTTRIVGSTATLLATALGTVGSKLDTTVGTLDATASGGGVYVSEADAVGLTASAAGGAVDVETTNGAITVAAASGDGVTLTAGGAGSGIAVDGVVNAGAGNVVLTAGSPAARGAITAGAGAQVIGSSLTALGSEIGTSGARLGTTVASLNATSTNGSIFVSEADALDLTAAASGGTVDVQTVNGNLTVAAASGANVTLSAGGAGSSIALNGTVNAGGGDVVLIAGTAGSRGGISSGAGGHVTANTLTAVGASIGASNARLSTAVGSLDATSENGGIFINEADALAMTAQASGGAVDVQTLDGAITVANAVGDGVTLTAGGAGRDITVNGSVNAGAGNVTLTAGSEASRGSIVTAGTGQIAGNALIALGSTIGTSGSRLSTHVDSMHLTSTNGGIFVTEADALTLDASATGGAVDVQTTNGTLTAAAVNGDGVTLTGGGAGLTVNGAVNGGAGGVTLTAAGAGSALTLNGSVGGGSGGVTLIAGTADNRGSVVAGAGNHVAGSSLNVTAAAVGTSAAQLNTSIDSLSATATGGGIHVSEANGLTLANLSASGDVGVTSASGDIVVETVSAGSAVSLTAAAGAITDDGDDTSRITSSSIALTARSIGAASTLSGATLNSTGRLDTDTTILSATATAGGVFIDEASDLQRASVQASGGADGDIELLVRSGDLNVQSVSASDTLLLAAGRNLFATASAGPIVARRAELRAGTTDAAGGQIGSSAKPLELQLSAGSSLRLFVPQALDHEDPNRGPATLPSAGVNTTLNKFAPTNSAAATAGFGQFAGLGETQFTSPSETLIRTLQSQTSTVQAGFEIDWVSFDPEVSLFGTLDPAVCLPSDQRDEEEGEAGC
jgi:filamentous hemagglutinin family protein